MVKYKQTVKEMIEANTDVFKRFKEIHDKYAQDPETWQEEFNRDGEEVLLIIQQWEKSLCSKSLSSQYSKFSSNLSDKFREEIKKFFPKIDYIGVTDK